MVYREFSCFLCGKKGIDRTCRQNRMFCSANCRNKYYYRMNTSKDIMLYKKKKNSCVHNDEVHCVEHNCDKCGWNPAVAQKRLESFSTEVEIDGEE